MGKGRWPRSRRDEWTYRRMARVDCMCTLLSAYGPNRSPDSLAAPVRYSHLLLLAGNLDGRSRLLYSRCHRRQPESPIGWLFCAIGLIFGVSHFSAEYAAYVLLARSRSLPADEAFAWLTSWVWVFGLGLIVFLDLLFPNGRLPSPRWRWFARFTAIAL